jgi:hypothetical protein
MLLAGHCLDVAYVLCSQYLDAEPVLPVGPGGFDFSFETDTALDLSALKRLILEESMSMQTERAMLLARMQKLSAANTPFGGLPASFASPTAASMTGLHIARSASGGSEAEDESMGRGGTGDFVARSGVQTVRYAPQAVAPFGGGSATTASRGVPAAYGGIPASNASHLSGAVHGSPAKTRLRQQTVTATR